MSSSDQTSLGPTLEEFASKHRLPARWLELSKACGQLVARSDFWYRRDLRDEARQLAVEASDILHAAQRREDQSAQEKAVSCYSHIAIGADR